jgi:spore maturation protein CgeB
VGIKKILYIAFKYEYGKQENGTALNYKAWFENFEKLGYEIEGIFFEDFSHEDLQKNILQKTKEIKPDLVFFILQKEQVEIATLEELQKEQFFTVCFFGDDQWRFDNWSSNYAPFFSACITTDKFSIDKYKEIGQNNIIYSQWASLESNIDFEGKKYKYDVSFVGGANAYRKWFVKELEKRGIKVDCFGNGWENGRVTYEQMEEIFSTSKINLNISNSVSYDMRYLLSSPRSFASTLKAVLRGGGKNSSQTKARNFEIPVQGGFQLTDYVPTLEEYYTIGKEIVCYSSVDEAEKLIKYYLKHENEREAIKLEGIKKARNEHTFKNRIIEFMKEIKKIHDNKK